MAPLLGGGQLTAKTLMPRAPALAVLVISVGILGFLARTESRAAESTKTYFEDVTARSGIRFMLENSASPQRHQIETMPGGVATFDFDNDGLPDIFFTNGAEQPSLNKTSPRFFNRLYRNKGNWRFKDVTEKSGVAGTGYDIGAATGDYDNDGNVDLFVVGVKRNTLFHNRGDGTFEDVTTKAGLQSTDWSVSAAWVDFDNDGKLDLFVVYYVAWDPATEPWCGWEPSGPSVILVFTSLCETGSTITTETGPLRTCHPEPESIALLGREWALRWATTITTGG